METILISGGTGMIGSSITQALLQRGFKVIVLTRNASLNHKLVEGLSFSYWNIREKTIDEEVIKKSDHIIHLAGASVAEKRWTSNRKNEIIASRVESGQLIVESLRTVSNHVKTVVSISGIGFYGPDPEMPNPNPFTEKDPRDKSFLAEVCKEWEAAIEPVSLIGKRLVKFRTGVVLSNAGGILKEFKKPLSFGIATILGNGKQVLSWIHTDDLVRLFMYALETESLEGVFNAVAPVPVSNRELILALANKFNPRFFIPIRVPSLVLKIVLGELSVEVLKSATVSSKKIQDAGFIFQYPDIESAIKNL